jgi:hypothetical protein
MDRYITIFQPLTGDEIEQIANEILAADSQNLKKGTLKKRIP